MKKTIVTHFSPDLDAICAIWVVKKFGENWQSAEVIFVPAGETKDNQAVDSDPQILHIDTGLGQLDHHQRDDESSCAAKLAWEWVKKNSKRKHQNGQEALERLLEVVNQIDHFQEVYWPQPESDRYDFGLSRILSGWKLLYPDQDGEYVKWGCQALEGIYKTFQNKVWAEKILAQEGIKFESPWGKAIALETGNDEVLHLGEKLGFVLVVRKDPKAGYVRIKTWPEPKIDLTPVFEKLKKLDPDASWFLHPNRHMLLNGSTKNPKMKPTKLKLEEIIEVLKK